MYIYIYLNMCIYTIISKPFHVLVTIQSMDDLKNRGAADRSNHVIIIVYNRGQGRKKFPNSSHQ